MDKEYFEEIYVSYFKVLHLFALRMVKDNIAAEDIVQDVFTDCWAKRGYIDISKSLKPYLYKTTYNHSLDFLKLSENNNVPISDKLSLLDDILYATFTTDDQLHLSDISREMAAGIDSLPQRCKEIFLLSRENNFKNREIAERLDSSVKAVEKQIAKALQDLKSHLVKAGYLISWILLMLFAFLFSI